MGLRKIAVIGAGGMAREHIRAAAALPDVEISGIYSRTREKAELLAKEFKIQNVAGSIAGLYQITQPQFVIITVSVADVADVIKQCVAYDWRILAEKPAALNYDKGTELLKFMGEQQHKVSVAMNRRCFSSTQRVLSELEKISSRRIVEISDQQSYASALSGHPQDVVENWMYANSIHLIDMANVFCRGAVAQSTQINPWHGLDTDFVLSHVRYDSGDEVLYRCYLKQPGPWAITVATEKKRFEMRPMEKLVVQNMGERTLNEIPVSEEDKNYKPGFVLQLSNFLNGKGVSFAESMKTMSLIKAIYGV